jgi:hypothetical protein
LYIVANFAWSSEALHNLTNMEFGKKIMKLVKAHHTAKKKKHEHYRTHHYKK